MRRTNFAERAEIRSLLRIKRNLPFGQGRMMDQRVFGVINSDIGNRMPGGSRNVGVPGESQRWFITTSTFGMIGTGRTHPGRREHCTGQASGECEVGGDRHIAFSAPSARQRASADPLDERFLVTAGCCAGCVLRLDRLARHQTKNHPVSERRGAAVSHWAGVLVVRPCTNENEPIHWTFRGVPPWICTVFGSIVGYSA